MLVLKIYSPTQSLFFSIFKIGIKYIFHRVVVGLIGNLCLKKFIKKFLTKLGVKLPYDSAIPLPGIHPEKVTVLKTHAPRSLQHCLQQPGDGSNLDVHQQTNGPGRRGTHTHNGVLLSHKRNAFESVVVRGMNLEPVIQSEISQKEKNIMC